MGRTGLKNVALLSYTRAHALQQDLSMLGLTLENPDVFYNEFVVKCPIKPKRIIDALARKGIAGGVDLGNNRMLVCCTEKNSENDINEYVKIVGGLI
jgi:glycine dehydrogenase subunit 1